MKCLCNFPSFEINFRYTEKIDCKNDIVGLYIYLLSVISIANLLHLPFEGFFFLLPYCKHGKLSMKLYHHGVFLQITLVTLVISVEAKDRLGVWAALVAVIPL